MFERLALIEKDKAKIRDTIDRLDAFKLDALTTTWKKVDAYACFNAVISVLFLATC